MSIITNGLVGYWNFNQGVDTVNKKWTDLSGANDLLITTTTSITVSPTDGVDFTGAYAYNSSGFTLNLTSYTLEIIYTPTNSTDANYQHLFATNGNAKTGQTHFSHYQNEVYYTTDSWGGLDTTYKASLNTQTVIAFTFDSTTQSATGKQDFYVNGSHVSQFGASNLAAQPLINGNITVGSSYKGYIAVIRVYNRALSATEISQNYSNGVQVGLSSGGSVVSASSAISGHGTLTSSGIKTNFGISSLHGNCIISANPTKVESSFAAISGRVNVSTSAGIVCNDSAIINGIAIVGLTGTGIVFDETQINGVVDFLATGTKIVSGIATMIGNALIHVDSQAVQNGNASIQVRAEIHATVGNMGILFGSADIQVNGSTSVFGIREVYAETEPSTMHKNFSALVRASILTNGSAYIVGIATPEVIGNYIIDQRVYIHQNLKIKVTGGVNRGMAFNQKNSMFSANDIKNILTAISNINHVFTETITLHQFTKVQCPSCEYDPIRNASTDITCPTCAGTGWIRTDNPITIQASADYEGDFDTNPLLTAQGFDSNIVYITIDIKELNTLNIDNLYDLSKVSDIERFLKSYEYITWDNANYELMSFQPGWLEGTLYEVALKMRRIIA